MTEPTSDSAPKPLASRIGSIVGLLAQPHATGLAAELRRMRPGAIDCAAFWKIAVRHLDDELVGPAERVAEQERRWAVVLTALATMASQHRPRASLGAAMAHAGVSEARVLKLLRARGATLPDALRSVCHQLHAVSQPVDLVDIALLVLSEGRSDEDRVRRRIARSFYRFSGESS